jgi:hypothetical protein
MSWLTQIFHRDSPAVLPSALPVQPWLGESGREYRYVVYPLDAEFRPLPGNYIYARPLAVGGGWVPIYIGQTRDLHQRLEGDIHPDTAAAHGATHLHAHYNSAGQAARCEEERDLIKYWSPECNERLES